MKQYELWEYSDCDEYGQPILEDVEEITMAIYITSQSVQDNINYKNASYIGFTNYPWITDKNVIQYDEWTKLKVLYINPQGRMKQVFMSEI